MILLDKIVFPDAWLGTLYDVRSEFHNRVFRIRRSFNYTERVQVVIFESTKQISDHFGFCVPDWIEATSFGDRIYLLRKGQGEDFEKRVYATVFHELVHLAVAQSFSAKCPLWLNEGLAVYYAGEQWVNNFSQYQQAYSYYERSYDDREAFYCQSAYAVARLIEKYGEQPFVEHCRQCTNFMEDRVVGIESLRSLDGSTSF